MIVSCEYFPGGAWKLNWLEVHGMDSVSAGERCRKLTAASQMHYIAHACLQICTRKSEVTNCRP